MLGPMPATVVVNPATAEPLADVASTSADEVDRAIERAHAAYPAWRAVAPADRARLLRRFATEVDAGLLELAALEVANAGHVIANARWEAGHVRDVLEYYAGAPERLFGRQIPVAGGIDVTFKDPLGVVGVIVPWNFPMVIAAWGFAPALAAGNTVVVKPAEVTPLSALALERMAVEAGIPPGVLQVVTGKGSLVGQRLVDHPAVRKICFTGSTEVGREIMAGCARTLTRVTLELGGKSANIVFADADLVAAAAAAPMSVFDNAGQDCCARSRILVERSVYERFLELLVPAVAAVRVGDPTDAASQMGPLISAAHRDHVGTYVTEDAVVARRVGTVGSRVLVPADGAGRGGAARRGGDRGDLRAGGRGVALRGRSARRGAGERLAVRAVGVAVDARRGAGAAGGACGRDGHVVGQLALVRALHHPVRWREAVGSRT